MECKKLELFVSNVYRNFGELDHVFSCGGYDIACDGYRLAAIRTGCDTLRVNAIPNKQKLVHRLLEDAIKNAETAKTFRFSRDLKKEIDKKYKEIRLASETTIYKRDLTIGLNYVTGEYVLFKTGKRERKEVNLYQYFNFKYFSDLLEFFPRFNNLDIKYRSGSRFTEIFVHLGTRYAVLLPVRIMNEN
jgi:hypothetical protein